MLPDLAGRLLSAPARWTPVACQAFLLEPVLNRVFQDHIDEGSLDFLRSSIVQVSISDIGLHWLLTLSGERVKLLSQGAPAVTISGGVREFLLLLGRREDPDTLFFERRLTVQGDTETGLLVKNLLDSIELTELPPPLRRAVELGASWVQ